MLSTNNSHSPSEIREIQEMAIAVSAPNLSPNLINLEYLKLSGTIPADWELARQPIVNANVVQIFFQNRVSIVGQPNQITFIENLGIEEYKDLLIPELVKQFTAKLPNADYQTLSFCPKSVIPMIGGSDAARQYITRTLLSPGSWQDIGRAPLQANLNLLYELDRCQLNIGINEANIQIPNQPSTPAVLFSGSFNYNLSKEDPSIRLVQLHKSIEHWDLDLAIFREMIEQRFLISRTSLFPPSFPMS